MAFRECVVETTTHRNRVMHHEYCYKNGSVNFQIILKTHTKPVLGMDRHVRIMFFFPDNYTKLKKLNKINVPREHFPGTLRMIL